MRAISLILVVACLGLSGCFHQKTQVASVKLMEISGDASGQQYTVSKTDGFLAGSSSGKIQLGQSSLGDFSYELYYLLSIGNGAGAPCTNADFTLRGIVMEKENGELIGIRFLKELTGKFSYDKGRMAVSDLSTSPSFINPVLSGLKNTLTNPGPNSNALQSQGFYSAFSIQFLPNPADQVNRVELVFDIPVQILPTRPSLPGK